MVDNSDVQNSIACMRIKSKIFSLSLSLFFFFWNPSLNEKYIVEEKLFGAGFRAFSGFETQTHGETVL